MPGVFLSGMGLKIAAEIGIHRIVPAQLMDVGVSPSWSTPPRLYLMEVCVMQRFFGFSVATVAVLALFTAGANACHRGHRHHGCATTCCAPVAPCCQSTPCGQAPRHHVATGCGCGSYATYAPATPAVVVVESGVSAVPAVVQNAPAN